MFYGVPQGSISEPLLFLIFINNIVSGIESNFPFFAHDTSMYIDVENPQIGPINGQSTLTPPNINIFSYHAKLA